MTNTMNDQTTRIISATHILITAMGERMENDTPTTREDMRECLELMERVLDFTHGPAVDPTLLKTAGATLKLARVMSA